MILKSVYVLYIESYSVVEQNSDRVFVIVLCLADKSECVL